VEWEVVPHGVGGGRAVHVVEEGGLKHVRAQKWRASNILHVAGVFFLGARCGWADEGILIQ
jgi:hypothetical protein